MYLIYRELMEKAASKAELLDEASHVTLELYQLQDKIAQLQQVFEELENRIAEVRGCIFPCSYIILKDMVEDVSDLAQRFRETWYGSTDNTGDNRRRGTITRLVENCKAFASNRQALSRLEAIQNGYSELKKTELKQELERRKAELAQQKLVFKQLGDLLQDLERLHVESKRYWICPRYKLMARGVTNTLYAYHHVPGLSSPTTTEGTSNDRRTR